MKRFSLTFLFVFFFITGYCEAQKKLAIVTYHCLGMQQWDPESINSGITGSEESVIYISKELALLGYQVYVLGNPPPNSPHSKEEANPRYVGTDFNDGTRFDIAISWRMPDAAEKLKKRSDLVYFWPHDTYSYPLTKKQIEDFDGVLWLSEWQRMDWIKYNPGFSQFKSIFGNGIPPDQFAAVEERENPYSCIYGSNYARGLDLLLTIWPAVKQQYPLATLDIYYGWQHWGLLSREKEAEMRDKVIKLGPLGVKEHGLVSHEELNKAYGRASFWTYPCVAPETFCITALRAQLSGAIPVIIDGSALVETVKSGYKCLNPEEYLSLLLKAMGEVDKYSLKERKQLGEFILTDYSWKKIAEKWNSLFED